MKNINRFAGPNRVTIRTKNPLEAPIEQWDVRRFYFYILFRQYENNKHRQFVCEVDSCTTEGIHIPTQTQYTCDRYFLCESHKLWRYHTRTIPHMNMIPIGRDTCDFYWVTWQIRIKEIDTIAMLDISHAYLGTIFFGWRTSATRTSWENLRKRQEK